MSTWKLAGGQPTLEKSFVAFKEPLDEPAALAEANRCINCYDAPCIQACPTRIDIPKFIRRIGSTQYQGAARTILDSNILGLSCALSCPTEVLCEGACVYNNMDREPISIGKLQRFAVEKAYEKGTSFYQAGAPTGKRVALVGAGPASLACAHELRLAGHEAVIFEAMSVPGGLNTSGIAPYKMKSETSLREIEQVSKVGVKFEFGKALGRDVKLPQLLKDYDAVFLGMGLGPDRKFDAPGSDHPKVQGAVDFIARLKLSPASTFNDLKNAKATLVIGGGNTALDACRELKKLGVPKVIVSYRRGESDMSGYQHELSHARSEGVEFWFNTLPTEITPQDKGLRVKISKTRLDAAGKVVLSDESLDLDVDLALVATGQSQLKSLLSEIPELKFENGNLKADAQGRTGHPKIFAGGDLVSGGKEIVNAVAEGKIAAKTIGALVGGGKNG